MIHKQITKGIWHCIASIKQIQKDRGMFPNKHYEIPFVKEYAAVLISKVNEKRHMPLRKSPEELLAFCIAIYERRCLWI